MFEIWELDESRDQKWTFFSIFQSACLSKTISGFADSEIGVTQSSDFWSTHELGRRDFQLKFLSI